jgi:hypothetical protein
LATQTDTLLKNSSFSRVIHIIIRDLVVLL